MIWSRCYRSLPGLSVVAVVLCFVMVGVVGRPVNADGSSRTFGSVANDQPTNTKAVVLADGRVRLTWDPPASPGPYPDSDSIYDVRYTTDNGKTIKFVTAQGKLSEGQVTVYGLPMAVKFRARPMGAPWSNEVRISAAITPVAPARLVDTRPGARTVDGRAAGDGAFGYGEGRLYPVAGRGGVPKGARAVVVNITPVGADAPGFVTAFSCEDGPVNASSANFRPEDGVNPNLVVVPLGRDGDLCLYSLVVVDLIVDVTGYVSGGSGSKLESVAPERLVDTRPGAATVDGKVAGVGRVADGGVLRVPVAGRGGVPAGAQAAMVNLTPVGVSGPGFVTAWSCDGKVPLASSANYSPVDGPNPNLALVPLNSRGDMCLYTLRATDLVVDVTGYVVKDGGSELASVPPVRLADTREAESTVDGRAQRTGRLADKSVLRIPVAGRAGVPKGARAAMVNLTPVGVTGPGFVTAWSCDGKVPLASSANYSPADGPNPNLALVPLNSKGEMCVYTLRSAHIVVDVTGFVAAS